MSVHNVSVVPLIHDGDHGGDDFVATILAAMGDNINLLAVTTCLGNAKADQAAKNACMALTLCGRGDIPVFIGETKPYKAEEKAGDNVFSSDGMGGVSFGITSKIPEVMHAVDAMAAILQASDEKVVICVTGPCTNIAVLLDKYPELTAKIDRLIIMGGGIDPSGNIKPYAEFNFYMDPLSVNRVFESGLDIYLHAMDTTHMLPFNAPRKEKFLDMCKTVHAKTFVDLMSVLEGLDSKAFNSDGAFMHDSHTVCSVLRPDLFAYETMHLAVNTEDKPGNLYVAPTGSAAGGIVHLCRNMTDIDAVFDTICKEMAKLD